METSADGAVAQFGQSENHRLKAVAEVTDFKSCSGQRPVKCIPHQAGFKGYMDLTIYSKVFILVPVLICDVLGYDLVGHIARANSKNILAPTDACPKTASSGAQTPLTDGAPSLLSTIAATG
jgi:hypothetical protein